MENYPMTSLLKSIINQMQASNVEERVENVRRGALDEQDFENFAKQHLEYLKQILVQEVN